MSEDEPGPTQRKRARIQEKESDTDWEENHHQTSPNSGSHGNRPIPSAPLLTDVEAESAQYGAASGSSVRFYPDIAPPPYSLFDAGGSEGDTVLSNEPDDRRGGKYFETSKAEDTLKMPILKFDFDQPSLKPARYLMRREKFDEAASWLEDRPKSPSQLLALVVCYVHLGNSIEAFTCLGELETMMMSPTRPKVDDVIKNIESYISKSFFTHALVLLSCASKLFKGDSNPDYAVCGIKDCSHRCHNDVFCNMVKQGDKMREIVRDFGIEIVIEMLSDLRGVNGADADLKSEMEANCLNNIGSSYSCINEWGIAIGCFEQSIDVLKRNFDSNAVKYSMFHLSLNNIGTAYINLKDYRKAKSFFSQSYESLNQVQNWKNNAEKEEFVQRAQNNIKSATDFSTEFVIMFLIFLLFLGKWGGS